MIMLMVVFAHLYALREMGLPFETLPLLILFLTTGFANAAVFALNQYYEREGDAKMERTKSRPIPSGRISPRAAFWAGISVFVLSLAVQYFLINTATMLATFATGALYVWTYTPLKSRSSLSTLIGSIPGALLPVIGWYSVGVGFDLMIWWMSLMIFLWQIPHTFVIVFRYTDQFIAAGGKQLQLVAGEDASFRQSLWYTWINIPLILVPFLFGVSGGIYMLVAVALTGYAIYRVTQFYTERETKSARKFFFSMLLYLPILFVAMATNRVG
jgi:protoheme IX farnesyltransferase